MEEKKELETTTEEQASVTPAANDGEKKGLFLSGLIVGFAATLLIVGGIFIAFQIHNIMTMKDDVAAQVSYGEDSAVNAQTIKNLQLLEDTVKENFYLSEVTNEQLEDGMFRGLMDSLDDPYSEYYTAEELNELTEQTQGIYFGIGAYVSMDSETNLPKISGVIEGAPAADVDLRANDIIYEVDGVSTAGKTLTEAVNMIRGEAGTTVDLTIVRQGAGDYLHVTVERAKVESPTVKYEMLDDNMAYIQIVEFDEICQWYDGYLFGKTEIFNPWSVVSYFSNKCEPRPFWVSTGSNDVIGEVLAVADNEIYDRLTSLVNGETFTTFIDTDVIYPQIKSNPSTIYSFLLMTGYLKVLNTSLSFNGDFLCEVALPNREISLVYNKEILQRMENIIPQATAISIQEATFSGDHKRLKSQLQMLLTQSVSFFDTAGENFYHGFMLGLCALMSGTFATSNRESGDGRYDIQLKPIRKGMPGILIELKAGKNCSDEELKNMSEAALKQITDKKYDTEMKNAGIQTIYKYGVAFSGKNVEIAVE